MASKVAKPRKPSALARITKSNSIIEAKYKLTVREQKLLLYMISLLRRGDEEFQTYVIFISDLEKILNPKDTKWGSVYAEFKDVVLSLKSKPFVLVEGERQLFLNWLDTISVIERNGRITFRFTEELKPYLLQLKENFTSYGLGNVLQLKSAYSIRLYELLKQYETIGRREFEVERLRELMGIDEGTIERYSNFKRLVLEKAREELAKKTDIRFTYEERKQGRRIAAICFHIEKNARSEETTVEALTQTTEEAGVPPLEVSLIGQMTAAGLAEADARRIWRKIQQERPQQPDWPAYFAEKLALLKTRRQKGSVDSPAGFLFAALRNDYQPEALATPHPNPKKVVEKSRGRQASESERRARQLAHLEAEKARLQEAFFEARAERCAALLEEDHGRLAELLTLARRENAFVAQLFDPSKSPEQNYQVKVIQTQVNAQLAAAYPERFADLEAHFAPKLERLAETLQRVAAGQLMMGF